MDSEQGTPETYFTIRSISGNSCDLPYERSLSLNLEPFSRALYSIRRGFFVENQHLIVFDTNAKYLSFDLPYFQCLSFSRA